MRTSTLSLALAAFLGLASVPAHAFFEANVAGGYTSLAMGDLNDALKKTGTDGNTPINGGYYISADAGIAMLPFLKLAPRVVYIGAGQGLMKSGSTETSVDANLVPLELGLTADLSVPLSGLSVRGGVWGGYGLATVATATKTSGVTTSTGLYQGSAFTAEALAAFRYSIVPFLALSIEAGYRLANVSKVQDSNSKALTKNGTDDLPFDYSGFNAGGGLTFSF